MRRDASIEQIQGKIAGNDPRKARVCQRIEGSKQGESTASKHPVPGIRIWVK